jgi:hypothetical protein
MLHIDLLDESTQFTTYATCQVSVAADDDAVEARDQRSLSVPAAAASISGHRFLDEFYADLESLSLFSSSDATIQAAYVYAFVHYFPDAVDQFGSESSGSDTGMFALAQSSSPQGSSSCLGGLAPDDSMQHQYTLALSGCAPCSLFQYSLQVKSCSQVL